MQQTNAFANSDQPVDRRKDSRTEYSNRVRIAYFRHGRAPLDAEFLEVQCYNLSRSGFSFWSFAAREEKELLVVFGDPPNEIRVKARVIHNEATQQDGKLRTLVGCEFLERM